MLETTEWRRDTLVRMGNKAGKPKHKPLPLQLKAARERLGMSQERLGELTGMTGVTIGRIEKGKQNWTQEFLQEAAAALNVHWTDLLPPDQNSILALWGLVPDEDRERAKSAIMIFAMGKTKAA